MDRNTMNVLIVLIVAILIICVIIAWMWMYTPYIGGYHHMGPRMHGY